MSLLWFLCSVLCSASNCEQMEDCFAISAFCASCILLLLS